VDPRGGREITSDLCYVAPSLEPQCAQEKEGEIINKAHEVQTLISFATHAWHTSRKYELVIENIRVKYASCYHNVSVGR
jgi:hypothetical protein